MWRNLNNYKSSTLGISDERHFREAWYSYLHSHFRNETELSDSGVSAFSLNQSWILLLGFSSYLGSWYHWHSDEPTQPMMNQVASIRLWSEYYLSNRTTDLFHIPFGSKAGINGKKIFYWSSTFFKANSSHERSWFRLRQWPSLCVCVGGGGSHSYNLPLEHFLFSLPTWEDSWYSFQWGK